MKKLKVSLVVLGLLLTGYVSGFLTNRYLVSSHIKRVQKMNDKKGFQHFLLKKLDISTEQKEQLQPILESHEKQYHELMVNAVKKRQVFADSLISEISPLLNDDQKNELKHFRKFLVRGPHKGRPARSGRHK